MEGSTHRAGHGCEASRTPPSRGRIRPSHRRLAERRYLAGLDSFRRALDMLSTQLQELLELEGLHVSVRARLKSFESYYRKLIGKLHGPGRAKGDASVNDLLGVRVICPFQGDLRAVEVLLRRHLAVLEVERKGQQHHYREFAYDSTHFLIRVPEPICAAAGVPSSTVCQVQVRTTLQEAWAEIEHELVYKAELTPLDEPMRRKLASLKAILTLSDNIFQELRDYQRQMREQLRRRKAALWARILEIAARGPSDATSGQVPPRHTSPGPGPAARGAVEPDSAEDSDLMLLQALSAHNRRELDVALRLYSRILELELAPVARTIVLLHRGMAFLQQGNLGEARKDFSDALRLDARSERAWFLRGITAWASGQRGAALSDLSESLRLNPLQSDVLACRALLSRQLGDEAGALADAQQVLAIAPEADEVRDLEGLLDEASAGEDTDAAQAPGPRIHRARRAEERFGDSSS